MTHATPEPTLPRRLLAPLDRLPRWAVVLVHAAMVLALGLGDFVTGADVAFTALYFIPIAIVAWYARRGDALLLAGLASATWLTVDLVTRTAPQPLSTLTWNLGVQLAVFATLALLVHKLRLALIEERRALIAEQEERLRVQAQLRHAERLSTVGRLAAGVAHELGTPLNVAGSYAQLIETSTAEGAAATDGARIIREQTESMTRIVRQLVDFARASKPQRAPQDVVDVVSAALSMLKPLAQKKKASLDFTPGEPHVLPVDATQLQQVVTNLVVNALQAMSAKGHVAVAVTRGASTPPPDVGGGARDCVLVTVKDDGPGIAPEVLPHVFEPFVTTKPVGEGTGLGLAVAWGIVKEHGGWLTAENAPEGGARFTVALPVG